MRINVIIMSKEIDEIDREIREDWFEALISPDQKYVLLDTAGDIRASAFYLEGILKAKEYFGWGKVNRFKGSKKGFEVLEKVKDSVIDAAEKKMNESRTKIKPRKKIGKNLQMYSLLAGSSFLILFIARIISSDMRIFLRSISPVPFEAIALIIAIVLFNTGLLMQELG